MAAACAPPNPTLQSPAPPQTKATQSSNVEKKTEFRPMVDVLFVIDNSQSMKDHQENLKRNIDRFVEAFESNKRLDFHIGVTTVFDSRRFDGKIVTADKFHAIGQLYPLKDPAAVAAAEAAAATDPNAAVPVDATAVPPLGAATFVTRAPGYAKVLGETLENRCRSARDRQSRSRWA